MSPVEEEKIFKVAHDMTVVATQKLQLEFYKMAVEGGLDKCEGSLAIVITFLRLAALESAAHDIADHGGIDGKTWEERCEDMHEILASQQNFVLERASKNRHVTSTIQDIFKSLKRKGK